MKIEILVKFMSNIGGYYDYYVSWYYYLSSIPKFILIASPTLV